MLMLDLSKEDLEKLIQLQDIDSKIIKLELKLKEIPKEIQRLEEIAQTRRNKVALIDQKIEELSNRRKELENIINESYKQIEESKKKKAKAKSLEDYKEAIKLKSEAEKKIIKATKEIEQILKELNSLFRERERMEESIKEFERKIAKKREEISKTQTLLERKLKELGGRREELVKQISPEVIEFYEEKKYEFGGKVFVPAHNKTCSGCSMQIPSAQYAKLLRGEGLVYCPNCGRILFIEKTLK
jgi:predicted  nucleic acid-binding Zn-ribbon protein